MRWGLDLWGWVGAAWQRRWHRDGSAYKDGTRTRVHVSVCASAASCGPECKNVEQVGER
jgi:hypothetical protein